MADVKLKCDSCNGQRFKDEILEVKFQKKNIADILVPLMNPLNSSKKQNKQKFQNNFNHFKMLAWVTFT